MSSHFNYEIDEKNLRVKLKGMSYPYKEDAWKQFEAYSETFKSSYKKPTLPNFNLNINRNVILPVVFGAVIILFSMLLFNFVSIKNKPGEKAEKQKVAEPKITPPEIKIVPVKKEEDKKELITQDTATVITTPTVAVVIPTVQTNTVAVVPVNTVAATPTVAAPIGQWTTLEDGQIYESPNINSKVIGNASGGRTFNILEETNYFIKITYDKSGNTGYFRKAFASKNGSSSGTVSNTGGRKKNRKAEAMESISVPAALPTGSGSDEKEPELR